MHGNKTTSIESQYYIGPERRHADSPRRNIEQCRRHRIRRESLISDCRIDESRRCEDTEGFIEISTLYESDNETNQKN